MKRKLIISSLLVLVVLVAAFAAARLMVSFRKAPPTRTPSRPATRVLAPPVEPVGDYRVRVVGYGSVQPKVTLDIAPRVGGEIVERSPDFFSGRIVTGPQKPDTPGQLLFRIDPEPYQLAVRNAEEGVALLEAQLKSLQQEAINLTQSRALETQQVQLEKQQLERVQALKQQGAGTQNEIDLARSSVLASQTRLQQITSQLAMIPHRRRELQVQLRTARVRLEQARLDLSWTTFRVPFTGRILQADIDVGEQINPGQSCGSLYGLGEMEIPVSVPAADLPWLGVDLDEADLTGQNKPRAVVEWSESGSDRTLRWTGRVERIEGGLEAQTRTARLVVAVRNDRQEGFGEPDFRPLDRNMYCKVTILGRTVPQAYLLPRSALMGGRDAWVVEEGRLARRTLRVARYTDSQAMLLPDSGLRPGDRVILNYLPKPVIGMKVEPIDADDAPTQEGLARPSTAPATAPAEDRSLSGPAQRR